MNNDRNPQIEQYLDRLCAEIQSLPPEVQAETRTEIGQHLYSLAAMQRDPQRIVESALRQFGDPTKVGQALALEWEASAWDLGQLSLRERLAKIREAIALETPPPHPWLQAIQRTQLVLLGLAVLASLPRDAGPVGLSPERGPWGWIGLNALGIYTAIGLLAALVEWRQAVPHGTVKKSRAYSNVIARVGASFCIPALFLLPHQAGTTSAALLGISLLLTLLNRFEASRRARLAADSNAVFGALLGVGFATLSVALATYLGPHYAVWLVLPLGYVAGRWWTKKPILPRRDTAS